MYPKNGNDIIKRGEKSCNREIIIKRLLLGWFYNNNDDHARSKRLKFNKNLNHFQLSKFVYLKGTKF